MQSPKIRAKRVGVIKDQICILKIQDTFVLSSICQKCQGTQIKAFLFFVIKEKYTQRGGSFASDRILRPNSSIITFFNKIILSYIFYFSEHFLNK